MLVQQLHQPLQRRSIQVHLGQNLDPLAGLGFHPGAQRSRVRCGAGQKQAFLQLVPAKFALHPAAEDFFFDQHQKKADHPKKDDDATSGLFAGEE